VFGSSLFAPQPDARWELPGRLREISGLACTPDGRLMGHEDETATIFQLDVETGVVVKRFAVGRPAVPGDFEGLAIDEDGVFYLITSNGQMYRFREGDDRAYVPFERFDTGMRNVAEVEGLTCRQEQYSVILACKCNYSAALQGALALYAWSPGNPEQHARPYLSIPLSPIAAVIGVRSFHASSVEIDPRTGRIVVLAGPENAMVELDPYGELLAARHLGALHSQAEGSAILPSGALMIADEGGAARAHLARYARLDV
jgi:hypothetical protein